MQPLRILTWHVHGNYLYYLSHVPHVIVLPVTKDRAGDYAGKAAGFPWPDNVVEVEAERISEIQLDCILFQRPANYFIDQYRILSGQQQALPRIYLEHDPPQQHPTNTKHWVQDPAVLVVHTSHFNQLMWDNGNVPTTVIQHGVVTAPGISYIGDIERGLVVINNLAQRARRLGRDIYDKVKEKIPLALIGMGSEAAGGLGEIGRNDLNRFESHYRFFFNPVRYTSPGLAVCEAMMVGLPVVGFATTEMAMTIQNGFSGYVDTDIRNLVDFMHKLLKYKSYARRLGEGARHYALQHFNIRRFADDWDRAFELITRRRAPVLVL